METQVFAIVLYRVACNSGRPATDEQLNADFRAHAISPGAAMTALLELERQGRLVQSAEGWAEKPRALPPSRRPFP